MIIFLNGTSSSGKTSIARSLLELSDGRFVHIEMDDALEEDPVETIYENGRTIYLHKPVYTKLYNLVANDDKDIILDGFFTRPKEFISYIASFLCSMTYFIKVIASIEKCTQREAQRRYRPTGTTAFFYDSVYESLSDYDFTIDTTADLEPSVYAAKILDFIGNANNPQAFKNCVQKGFDLSVEELKSLDTVALNKELNKASLPHRIIGQLMERILAVYGFCVKSQFLALS